MHKLTANNLLSLEDYDKQREAIKSNLIKHKKNRAVSIGNHIVLLFEDFETIKYQVQEMLRIEKIFNKEESTLCRFYQNEAKKAVRIF